jgi:hypothetical protein
MKVIFRAACGVKIDPCEAGKPARVPKTLAASLEEVDFFKTPELRQAMFLLPEPDQRAPAVPGSRGAAGAVRAKFLPKPGFLLCGLQCEERRTPRGRVSPPALPRALLESAGAGQPHGRLGRPDLRQTPPAASQAFFRPLYGRAVGAGPCVISVPPSRIYFNFAWGGGASA